MQKAVIACVFASTILSGCASTGARGPTWTPTIDTRGVDTARYENDLGECRAYAQANPDADSQRAARDGAVRSGGTVAALGAGYVALTGGLALVPMLAGTIATGAGWSALFGGGQAASQADAKHRTIVASCLTGRGYSVLG